MKFRNIFWGIILILLGVLFTLDNLHVIDFDWYNLWRLWPVVLVLWGVSILPVKDFIKIILVLVVLGASVSYMVNNTVHWNNHDFEMTYFDDDVEFEDSDQEFTIPFLDTVEFVQLDMEVAVNSFWLMNHMNLLISRKRAQLLTTNMR